jgi:hypothetical protein
LHKHVTTHLTTYIVYKTKLKTRRRYSILERLLSRFSLGQVLSDKIYLIIPLFGL